MRYTEGGFSKKSPKMSTPTYFLNFLRPLPLPYRTTKTLQNVGRR